MSPPRVVCVMPVLNEEAHLPGVLASLSAQDFDRARLRFIIVDNGSADASATLVERWLHDTQLSGEIVHVARRSIPLALNTGIARASADDVIIRLDAHTLYDAGYIRTIVEAFERLEPDVMCLGGAPTTAAPHDFASALREALYTNPMGLGPADFRSAASDYKRVSTVYLGAWRPGVLQRFGGFDEAWTANEDCELTERIRANGGAIARVPVRCGVINTRGPVATIQQWMRYGFWRAQTFKRYPAAIRPRHVIVPLVLVTGTALLFSPGRAALVPLYASYALATVAARRSGERPAITAASLIYFPLLHAGYAGGLIAGAFRTPASLRQRKTTKALPGGKSAGAVGPFAATLPESP